MHEHNFPQQLWIRTQHDDMNASLVECLCYSLSPGASAIVGIIDDNLASTLKEVPDQLFAATRNLLSEFLGFDTLLALFRRTSFSTAR